MTPSRIAATIAKEGEPVLLQRPNPAPTLTANWGIMPWGSFPWAGNMPGFDTIAARAVVRRYTPDTIVQGATQADILVRFAAAELAAAGWPGAPRKGDRVVRQGASYTVQGCETLTLRGGLAMHVVQARGG